LGGLSKFRKENNADDDERYSHLTTSRTHPNTEKVTEMVRNYC
jgi:hypothetical protein